MFASLILVAALAAAPFAETSAPAPAKAAAAKPAAQRDDGGALALQTTPFFRTLSVADGLPSNHVYKIVQDRDGFIWIGTHDGLARYDGVSFRVWRHDANDPTSLSGDDVSALYVDRDNRIWCGGEDAGLNMLDTRRERFVHFRHDDKDPASLSGNDVWTITGQADGTIWVGSYAAGLDRLASGATQFIHYKHEAGNADSIASDTVLALQFDRSGRLWIGTDLGMDVLPQNAPMRHVDFSAVSNDGRFNAVNLIEEADGRMLAATRHGLLRVDNALKAGVVIDKALIDPIVFAIAKDEAGDLWIANRHGLNRLTADGRLYGYKENSSVPGGVPGATVFDAMVDREGGLWVATLEGGIARLPAQWRNFSLFRNDPVDPGSLAGNQILGLAAADNGELWAVDGNGDIERLDPADGRIEHVGAHLTVPEKRLLAVLPDRLGQLWVGYKNGIRVFDLQKATFSDLPLDAKRNDALMPGQLNLLVQADSGAIWASASASNGALHRIDPLTHAIERFDAKNAGMRNGEVDQIGFDRDGALLVASGAGLDRFDTTVQHFSAVPGAPAARLLAFAFAADATIWLHTPGALEHYRFDAGTLKPLDRVDAKSGWPVLTAGGMQIDASGAIWVSSARGLWRYDPASRAIRVFDTHDGLASAEFNHMPLIKRRDGSLFGGTTAGIVGFMSDRVMQSVTPPPIALEDIVVRRDGRNVSLDPIGGKVELRWDDRDLRVSARALSFANPSGNRYQWRVAGVDADWVDTGNRGEREFPQVPVGRHPLALRAANAGGVWSESAPFVLEQAAPPWATGWAYFAYLAILVLLAWLAFHGYRGRLERRHAYTLAEQQVRFAEQSNAAKTSFLATMGHEIRTPMTGVLGMTELLLRTPLDAQQRGYAEAIASSGQMMLRLVNDSLDIARIEAGKLELEDAPLDLHALLDEIVALGRSMAQRKDLTFAHTLAPDTPCWVRGDAVRIKQIFLNLVNNAIKFTERGSVAVELARAPNGRVQFSIRDTGPGIAESTRARLFQRFEQAQGAQRHGGSGLGLAICRELVARMGGDIQLDSAFGAGSRFVVTLPLVETVDTEPSQMQHIELVPVEGPVKPAGLRILLVEDDAIVARVIVGLLQAQGHRVQHVLQGLAALGEVQTQTFAVALLDLDLPGVDGLTLARMLRAREAQEQRSRMTLIGISTRSAGNEEELCLRAGMDAFLRKPVTGETLRDCLRTVATG